MNSSKFSTDTSNFQMNSSKNEQFLNELLKFCMSIPIFRLKSSDFLNEPFKFFVWTLSPFALDELFQFWKSSSKFWMNFIQFCFWRDLWGWSKSKCFAPLSSGSPWKCPKITKLEKNLQRFFTLDVHLVNYGIKT